MTNGTPCWPKAYFPAQIGLDIDRPAAHIQHMVGQKENRDYIASLIGITSSKLSPDEGLPIVLAEADIDPRTGGAVAVASIGSMDDKGKIGPLTIEYWRKRPGAGDLRQKLIEIEPEYTDDKLTFSAVRVLGRHVDTRNVRDINRVLEAARQINHAMRQGQLPEIAQIFDKTFIHDVVGEKLPVTGLSSAGGFDFEVAPPASREKHEITLPPWFAQALIGRGVNTLDEHQILQNGRPLVMTEPHTGNGFVLGIQVESDRNNLRIQSGINPLGHSIDHAYPATPELCDASWARVPGTARKERLFRLAHVEVLGTILDPTDEINFMRGLGVVHDIARDARDRRYPRVLDSLAEHDLLDLYHPLPKPPPLEQGGRFYMVSLLGNGEHEIAADFGDQIGATKMLVHEGTRSDGTIDRVAVGHDLGMFLPRADSSWTGAVPDVTPWLDVCDHWFITHRHLDHAQGIPVYARKGLLKDKVFHATPDVIRQIEKSLVTADVRRENWPQFDALTKDGFFHLEKDGMRRISVEYAPRATPHSARTTPFRYIGRYGAKILGSYLNPGDMRFGRQVAEHNDDRLLPLWIDSDFFRRGLRGLARNDDMVDPKDTDRQDTLCDFDITAVRRRGWAPTEPDIQQNLQELTDLFPNKGILLAQISTNETRFETVWRTATLTGRHQFELGHYLEETARTLNKLGVNSHLQPTDTSGDNIQKYGDWYYQQHLRDVQHEWRGALLREQNTEQRTRLVHSIDLADWMLGQHERLSDRPVHLRYSEQKEQEHILAQKIADCPQGVMHDLPRHFGAIHTSRTSKTAHEIGKDPTGRRIVLLTGTQGNLAEAESQLAKIVEGRSFLDADPETRGSALPMKADQNIIILSQIAIPGNEKSQQAMVDRLVRDRDFTVVVAVHQGFEIYNLRPDDRKHVVDHYRKTGVTMVDGTDGRVTILQKPLHAPGHGYEHDVRAFANLVRPDIAQPQHINDPLAVERSTHIFNELGLRSAGRMFRDFEAIEINKGDHPASASATPIGVFPASMVAFRLVRKFRRMFGGHLEARRMVRFDQHGDESRTGLMAEGTQNIEQLFPVVDPEQIKRWRRKDPTPPPQPSDSERSPPIPHRRARGPNMPKPPAMAG